MEEQWYFGRKLLRHMSQYYPSWQAASSSSPPPGSPPSVHISLYLPTSGREPEFVEEISKLTVFREDHLENNQEYIVYIRGDSNVNKNHKDRMRIMRHFMNTLNLMPVPVPTYHHFLGNNLLLNLTLIWYYLHSLFLWILLKTRLCAHQFHRLRMTERKLFGMKKIFLCIRNLSLTIWQVWDQDG